MSIYALGIDAGSSTMKVVGVDAAGKMEWQVLEQAEPRIELQANRLLSQAFDCNNLSEELPVLATGYGRRQVKQATRSITEITCHARGVFQEFKHGGTLIDIGGQDSKVIRINPAGNVVDFAMNDRCAAGTGRFLENTANRLTIPVAEFAKQAMTTTDEAPISSTCTVFAESEIISLIAFGTPVPEILRGLHRALVKRVIAMVHSVGFEPPLMLSGGVVQNSLIVKMFSEELGQDAVLPKMPQLMGAFGAALIALKKE